MAGLPGVRRIVTDHTPDGKAIFGQDEVLRPANPVDPKGGPVPEGSLIPSFTSIFRTDTHPASPQGPWTDPHGKLQNLVGDTGVTCRTVDFPPVPDGAPETVNIMHRTLSVDYGVVLEGEIDLVLDDGERTTMRRGDVVVQRGTVHLWNNRSGANCRVFFVLVPARAVRVEGTGEVLQGTDTGHLERGKEGWGGWVTGAEWERGMDCLQGELFVLRDQDFW
ncbi:hypothetical protein LTR70_008312 [Exophiala xenobiotica]|uniref:Cupin type-2 domain-containing protein n=1 Tax=Lithohypha guttulata TaxID=1690604 RepID=A0ABR0K1N8_9EURO|nr:hypothetical protein LTR24_007890 [Lithohypha guttulata]KAK5312215.1 hypothetical protein LTR70_008312 [Exophiala xenobiotica]